MDSEHSFIINGENIYTKQVLVEFDNVPVFFVCKGESYYLTLCTDLDAMHYYVVPVSIFSVYDLLCGNATMRETLLAAKGFWEIKAADEIEKDIVQYKDISDIDRTLLPAEGAYYQIPSDEIKAFADEVGNECINAFALLVKERSSIIGNVSEKLMMLDPWMMDQSTVNKVIDNVAKALSEMFLAQKAVYKTHLGEESKGGDTWLLAA